jgi:hypothetical protein
MRLLHCVSQSAALAGSDSNMSCTFPPSVLKQHLHWQHRRILMSSTMPFAGLPVTNDTLFCNDNACYHTFPVARRYAEAKAQCAAIRGGYLVSYNTGQGRLHYRLHFSEHNSRAKLSPKTPSLLQARSSWRSNPTSGPPRPSEAAIGSGSKSRALCTTCSTAASSTTGMSATRRHMRTLGTTAAGRLIRMSGTWYRVFPQQHGAGRFQLHARILQVQLPGHP